MATSKDFEKKLENSKEILEKLMNPEVTLQDSVKYYKDGMSALSDAQKILEEAKLEFETVKESQENI